MSCALKREGRFVVNSDLSRNCLLKKFLSNNKLGGHRTLTTHALSFRSHTWFARLRA